MQIFWKKSRGFPVCCLSFLSDPSSESEQLPGNRKASRISDRASQALPLRYQFFLNCADAFCYISFLFCSAKISPCRPKLPHRKKIRPFRTGTPPDDCCMYLDLESLHRTGFSGRSIKGRRILPLPFFQAVPRIHRPLLHGFRHQGTAPYRRKPVKKIRISRSPKCRSNPVLTVFLRLTESFEIKNVSPTDFRQMYLQSYQK